MVRIMTKPFNASSKTIAELESNEIQLCVPPYQRPFCWTNKQVEVLVGDLVNHYQRRKTQSEGMKSFYSLGTVVCNENEGRLEVLDGQQRLTSINIILEILKSLSARTSDEEQKESIAWTPSIIKRYENLCSTNAKDPAVPFVSQSLLDSIKTKLNRAREDRLIDYEELRSCIRDSVHVLVVNLPISDSNAQEGPAMFEIVNMRGQMLRTIDIAKAQLIGLLQGAPDSERIAFDRLWTGTAELIRTAPAVSVEDLLKQVGNCLVDKTHAYDATLDGILFADITSNLRQYDQLQAQPTETETAKEEDVAITDFENLFVIANELLRHYKNLGGHQTLNIRPNPEKTDYVGLHERIVAGKFGSESQIPDSELSDIRRKDVWRFMTILFAAALTLQQLKAVQNSRQPLSLLAKTFIAANGYQYSGQYWLLLLVQTVIHQTLDQANLFESAEAFNGVNSKAYKLTERIERTFNDGFDTGYQRLLLWGLERFVHPANASNTKAALELPLDSSEVRNKAAEIFDLIDQTTAFDEWRYGCQGLRWKLFFVDFLMWLDSLDKKFSKMKAAFEKDGDKLLKLAELSSVGSGLFASFKELYEKKCAGMSIVSRSDIEHWIAQKTELANKDAVHDFANLALINASENVANYNKTTEQKANELNNNPAMKLLWLAAVAKASSDGTNSLNEVLCSGVVDHFWASYIGSFKSVVSL